MSRDRHYKPPRLAQVLLGWLLADAPWQTPLGDFEEYYNEVVVRRGVHRARLWYWGQVVRLVPDRLYEKTYWGTIMLTNYLKIALRNLRKHKGYSFINLLGLTVGMACCLLIYLVVQHELSYDRYHDKADQIHRLIVDWTSPTWDFKNALTSAPMGPRLIEDFPEVLDVVRFMPSMEEKVLVHYEDRRFYSTRFMYADASVFNIFSFGLYRGNPETALAEPNTIVVTETMAAKYFGKDDPMGKVLRVDNQEDFLVTGVVKDVPANSHFRFDFLASFKNLEPSLGTRLQSWSYNPFFTFVLLPDGYPTAQLEAQLPEMLVTHAGEDYRDWGRLAFQPLTDIHLNPLGNEIEPGSSTTYVYLLSVVALLILAIACFNFINLATARSSTRAKEISMRKVVGAQRRQLIIQFIGESVLLSLAGMIGAVVVVFLVLPTFGDLVGKELNLVLNWPLMVVLVGLVLLIGVLAGVYPAFILSRFNPVGVLKGILGQDASARFPRRLRGALVVFQFSISVILIVATLIVHAQLDFMHTKDLGLQPEQVVAIPVQAEAIQRRADVLRASMLRVPGVNKVAFSDRKPSAGAFHVGLRREGASDEERISPKYAFIDYDYLATLDINLMAGRNFSKDFPADEDESTLLNEEAVRALGWASPEEALGAFLVIGRETRVRIVGVVNDFHILPLRHQVQPMVMFLRPGGSTFMFLKISTHDVERTLAGITQVWSEMAPEWPLSYSFLDEDFQNLYASEERFGKIFGSFTLLALFIAALGLFGLATFSAERRTKEMGIRKAMGASAWQIVLLLSKDIAKLVVLANLIAWPVAYYAAEAWLQHYPYRIAIAVWIFVVASLAAFLIAWFSISYQALQASRANPVEALRYE